MRAIKPLATLFPSPPSSLSLFPFSFFFLPFPGFILPSSSSSSSSSFLPLPASILAAYIYRPRRQPTRAYRLMAVQIVSIESVGSLVAAILLRISCVPSLARDRTLARARAPQKKKKKEKNANFLPAYLPSH